MPREVFANIRFTMKGHSDKVDGYLYRDELEAIIEDFSRKQSAYDEFISYCEFSRNFPDKVPPKFEFQTELVASIDKHGRYGGIFLFAVLEELMKRQGLPVDWS